jgi:hypothetical protein
MYPRITAKLFAFASFLVAVALPASIAPVFAQEHGIPPLSSGEDSGVISSSRLPQYKGEMKLSGLWFFDLGADVNGHRGWGGALDFLVYSPREKEHPDWLIKMGGELLVFHTTESHHAPGLSRHKESLDAGELTFQFACSWNRWRSLEIGVTGGLGIAGTYLETRDDYTNGSHKSRYNGNVNWAMQINPAVTFHFPRHASLSLGYRAGFITPILRTEYKWVDYRTVDIFHQSVEASFIWRF